MKYIDHRTESGALTGWWIDPDALEVGNDWLGVRSKCTSAEALAAAWRMLVSSAEPEPIRLAYLGNVYVDLIPGRPWVDF